MEDVVQSLVEGDVLTVQVQHQHGTVAEGVELLSDEVDEVEQHHGNDRGEEEIPVLAKGPVPKGSHGIQRLEQPVFAQLGGVLSGIHVYSLSFGLRNRNGADGISFQPEAPRRG